LKRKSKIIRFTEREWEAIELSVKWRVRGLTEDHGEFYYIWKAIESRVKKKEITLNDLARIYNSRMRQGATVSPWGGKRGLYRKIREFLLNSGFKMNLYGEFIINETKE